MTLTLKNSSGAALGEVEVRFSLIENGRGTQAVQDAVVAYMSSQRSGTACTKTMGEVQGTGKKPWRQKGTGRARAGSFASPLWRGGGVVFGPKPRDFSKKLTRSTKRLSVGKAFSERIKSGNVSLIDEINFAQPKTTQVLELLASLRIVGTVLIVVRGTTPQNLLLSARNIPHVEIVSAEEVNAYQLLRPDNLLFTSSAFESLQDRIIKRSKP